MPIKTIAHKGLRELYENGTSKRVGVNFHKKLTELLDILEAATSTIDLAGVSNFHPLKGNRKGEYAMHVNGPWVVTFKFEDGEALDVTFEQYH